jgi:hypothetical protein
MELLKFSSTRWKDNKITDALFVAQATPVTRVVADFGEAFGM